MSSSGSRRAPARPGALVALLVGLGAAASLAGCGGSGEKPKAPAAPRGDARPAAPARLAGRIGDATTAARGKPLETLSGGSPLRSSPLGGRRPGGVGVGAGAGCAGAALDPSAGNTDAVSGAILCLLNGERQDHGLAPLRANAQLARAAADYSQSMVRGSFFSHTGQDGSDVVDRLRAAGYIRDDAEWTAGENLAWGTGALARPQQIMAAWMSSPGHRANILQADYKEIGIGLALGNPASPDGTGATVATEFGALQTTSIASTKAAARTTPSSRSSRTRQRRCLARAARARKGSVRAARRACRRRA